MARRTSVVLGSAVAGIVVLAGVAGVVAVGTSGSEVDPSTPTGVVQAYLRAIADGEVDTAVGWLAPDGPCTFDDLSRSYLPTSLRAVLGSTSGSEDRQVVSVEITEGSGGDLFGSDGYGHTERFVLERSADGWVLTGTPWPMFDCGQSTR